MPGYFDDLSDCSSRNDEQDSESDNDDDDDVCRPFAKKPRAHATSGSPYYMEAIHSSRDGKRCHNDNLATMTMTRCILHVDVDCFYCQCEKIDRNLSDDRPFAIGQKHIIVTCNYAARRLGIKKLESRDKAYEKCPNLLILEGSDLTRYRIHARRIYDVFRTTCKQIKSTLPVAKGSMDEMMADLTLAVVGTKDDDSGTKTGLTWNDPNVHVYGDGDGPEQTVLTEDQTGDTVVVMDHHVHVSVHHDDMATAACLQRAASLAVDIRQAILRETGFHVTMGISTNPLLAKLASGLKKPGIVNLLYPWRSQQLLEHLPLRKVHGAGRRTLQVLEPCLRKRFPHRQEPIVWTCRDLCEIPDFEIASCLDQMPSRESGQEQAQTLLLKCNGIDHTPVEDDLGGLPKTVSVEDSFRRGTVTTREAVMKAVRDVCKRLPALLHERYLISNTPLLAYPSTLRLAVRLVMDSSTTTMDANKLSTSSRRPYVTFSKQISFPGKQLLQLPDYEKPDFLYQHMRGMLRSLVLDKASFDVTRLNLGTTNFGDLEAGSGVQHGGSCTFPSPQQSLWSRSVTKSLINAPLPSSGNNGETIKSAERRQAALSKGSLPSPKDPPPIQTHETKTKLSLPLPLPEVKPSPPPPVAAPSALQFSGIDPAVLAELPPAIQAQIRQSFSLPRKRTRIEDFFRPVKSKK